MENSERTPEDIRREWLAKLGREIELDYPFFPVEDAFVQGPTRTVAVGELCSGTVVAGDELEAVGILSVPTRVVVTGVTRPRDGTGVEPVVAALPGGAYALTLDHASSERVVFGQCLAPPGALSASATVSADVWVVSADDLPGSALEHRRMLEEVAVGRGLELFFHTRAVEGRALERWAPSLGAEYRLTFELGHSVALFPEARFALRHSGLTIGAGIVRTLAGV